MHPAQFHVHPALSSQHKTILYSAHWCSHNTQSFLNSFSVGTSTSCSRSFIMLTRPRATSKFPNALHWHKFLHSLRHMVLHKYRMQCLHANGSPCDDSQFLGVSQLSIPILQVRFGVQNRSAMTLHTHSLLLSTHNSSYTPLACLLGARRVDPSCDRLHMQIACRNRMPRDHNRDIAHL